MLKICKGNKLQVHLSRWKKHRGIGVGEKGTNFSNGGDKKHYEE